MEPQPAARDQTALPNQNDRFCFCVLFVLLGIFSILRASSPPPDGYEQSDNGAYQVFVKRGRPSEFSVSKVNDRKAKTVWNATTKNFPLGVFLSNNGSNIVTIDSWGGPDDYAVAVYSAKGELAHYSFRELAPPLPLRHPILQEPAPPSLIEKVAYFDSFSLSWNEDAFTFFHPEESPKLFCIWISWRGSWVAFDLTDGSIVVPDDASLDAINRRASTIAHQDVIEPSSDSRPPRYFNRIRALKFISSRRVPEDRVFLEQALRAREFYASQGTINSDVALFGGSSLRANADVLLAKWDGHSERSGRTRQADDASRDGGCRSRSSKPG